MAATHKQDAAAPWPELGDMGFMFLLKKNGDGWLAEQVDTHDVFALYADSKP